MEEAHKKLMNLLDRRAEAERALAELKKARAQELVDSPGKASKVAAKVKEVESELEAFAEAVKLQRAIHRAAVSDMQARTRAEYVAEAAVEQAKAEELKGKAALAFQAAQLAQVQSQEASERARSLRQRGLDRQGREVIEGTPAELRESVRTDPTCTLDGESLEAALAELATEQRRNGFPPDAPGQGKSRNAIQRDGARVFDPVLGIVRIMWDHATGKVTERAVAEVYRLERRAGAVPEPIPRSAHAQGVTYGRPEQVIPPGFHRASESPEPSPDSRAAQAQRELAALEARKAALSVKIQEVKEQQKIARAVAKVKQQGA